MNFVPPRRTGRHGPSMSPRSDMHRSRVPIWQPSRQPVEAISQAVDVNHAVQAPGAAGVNAVASPTLAALAPRRAPVAWRDLVAKPAGPRVRSRAGVVEAGWLGLRPLRMRIGLEPSARACGRVRSVPGLDL